MIHPAEWGHWYSKDGKPAYEVPYADPSKGMRPVNLSDARKLGLLPSVTTIIQEASKPGLERWKVTQGILSALTLPRLPDETLDNFAERAQKDSQEQARKAAEKGTAIHAAIQDYYHGGTLHTEMIGYVLETVKAVDKLAGTNFKWTVEGTIIRPDYGGKCDLHGGGFTLDFKSKEFGPDFKKLAWDEHCIQLAAYREPGDRCANVFISVNNPGLIHVHEWKEDELQRGWLMFEALKSYFYARTGLKR